MRIEVVRLRSFSSEGNTAGSEDDGMTPVVIIATLVSDDTAIAGDIVARGRSPVFALCRALLAAGADPNARLDCYRGTTLAVVVKSLGRGALLTVKERDRGGLEIARWEAFPCSPVSPRIRQNGASVQTGAASLPDRHRC
jgi:hypothetical protein